MYVWLIRVSGNKTQFLYKNTKKGEKFQNPPSGILFFGKKNIIYLRRKKKTYITKIIFLKLTRIMLPKKKKEIKPNRIFTSVWNVFYCFLSYLDFVPALFSYSFFFYEFYVFPSAEQKLTPRALPLYKYTFQCV